METSSRNLALVTGASSGIGLELTKQFAAHDFDLVIAAEDAELAMAAEGIAASGVSVEAVHVDLATEIGVDRLCARVRPARSRRSTKRRSRSSRASRSPSATS